MERRVRKQTERYRPTNFNKSQAPQKQQPQKQQQRKPQQRPPPPQQPPSQALIDPNVPVPAIEIIDPKTPVPKDSTGTKKELKGSINKKLRKPSFYKVITKAHDETSEELDKAIKSFEFDTHKNNQRFSIWEKMTKLQESLNPILSAPNSWTNHLYMYDLTKQQYKELSYIHNPILQEIKNKSLYSSLRSMIGKLKPEWIDNNLVWMVEQHRYIMLEMLIQRFKNDNSLSTYWNDLKSLTRLIKICLGDEHELYYKMSTLATDFNIGVIQSQEGLNQLNKYEQVNFLPFGKLLDLTEEMLDMFIKRFSDNANDAYKYHIYTLILMAYLYTPPVRLELKDMKITQTLENLDKKFNYVYVPDNGLIMYIFNKIHKLHPPIKYKVGWFNNQTEINPLAYKLSDFVRESIALYPREYFITRVNDMSEPAKGNMTKYLASMFQGHSLSVNMFRSSFITWLYSNNTPTYILGDVSLKMRNSITAQFKNYKKALMPSDIVRIKQEGREQDSGPITITDNVEQEPLQRVPTSNQLIRPRPPPPDTEYVDPVTRQHKYLQRHIKKIGEKAYKKKQHDYFQKKKNEIFLKRTVRRVNEMEDSNVRPSTIKKYDLYKEGGVWKSRLIK